MRRLLRLALHMSWAILLDRCSKVLPKASQPESVLGSLIDDITT